MKYRSQDIRTVTALMNAAAEALQERDPYTLEDLGRFIQDWLQPEDERQAQQNMLDAMMESLLENS
jgi:predicted nuclease of restriction endonuclease-like (RecB) superfamily